VTPGRVTGGMARGAEQTGETSWRNAFAGTEAPTTRPVGSARMYVVKPGDTLWSIAKAEYGSASYFPHLARANPKVEASRLKAGSRLMIPGKDEWGGGIVADDAAGGSGEAVSCAGGRQPEHDLPAVVRIDGEREQVVSVEQGCDWSEPVGVETEHGVAVAGGAEQPGDGECGACGWAGGGFDAVEQNTRLW
jgi:LysM repeat protein